MLCYFQSFYRTHGIFSLFRSNKSSHVQIFQTSQAPCCVPEHRIELSRVHSASQLPAATFNPGLNPSHTTDMDEPGCQHLQGSPAPLVLLPERIAAKQTRHFRALLWDFESSASNTFEEMQTQKHFGSWGMELCPPIQHRHSCQEVRKWLSPSLVQSKARSKHSS